MDAPWCLLLGFLFVNADGVVVLMNVVHVNVRGKKCNKQCGIAVAKYGSSEDSVQVVWCQNLEGVGVHLPRH